MICKSFYCNNKCGAVNLTALMYNCAANLMDLLYASFGAIFLKIFLE